ncbi:MAG: hypothetical protein R2771_02470 [Saprospiraceae bacterium]
MKEPEKYSKEFKDLKECIDYYGYNKDDAPKPIMHMSVETDSIIEVVYPTIWYDKASPKIL